MNQTLNIDPAANLPITGIYTGQSFEIAFINYTDKTKTATKDFTGTYSLIVYSDAEMSKKLLPTIIEGANLIKAGNRLTFKMNKTENKFRQPGTYYYQIIDDINSEKSFVAFKGPIHVKWSR